jgi:KaiC/GvpD/RAD55 family RecA-like ATPase
LLNFGIPNLDALIDSDQDLPRAFSPSAESIAILGPDGSGKSILALHLASRYIADCERLLRKEKEKSKSTETIEIGRKQIMQIKPADLPRILYISSDLKYASAEKIWKAFQLDKPNKRHIPFEKVIEALKRREKFITSNQTGIGLKPFEPSETDELVNYFMELGDDGNELKYDGKFRPRIAFLDLAAHTAGDDWKFVNSLLVKLQSIESGKVKTDGNDAKPLPHLVIIDSVEGFETFVGKLDSYGVEQSRRARVAQCVRNAADRVHLVFVVEEPDSAEHLAEEYVTDVVLRSRKRAVSGPTVLSVEVQKARSRNHAKGEHPFEIRHKNGTSTGTWENVDTPIVHNAYVQVFTSLAHRSYRMSVERIFPRCEGKQDVAQFGLNYLDRLLWSSSPQRDGKTETDGQSGTQQQRQDGSQPKQKEPIETELRGLLASTATALIGDPSTGKSILGERFLAEGFKAQISEFIALYTLEQYRALIPKDNVERYAYLNQQLNSVLGKLRRSIYDVERSENNSNLPGSWTEVSQEIINAITEGMKATRSRDSQKGLGSVVNRSYSVSNQDLSDRLQTLTKNTDNLTEEEKALIDKEKYQITNEIDLIREEKKLQKDWEMRLDAFNDSTTEVAKKDSLDEEAAGKTLRSRSNLVRPWDGWDQKESSPKMPSLLDLFRHPNLIVPGVLLTTRDRRGAEVADRCLKRLKTDIDREWKKCAPENWDGDEDWKERRDNLEEKLKALIEYQLVVRRFDMQALPEAAVFHIVRRNLLHAVKMLFGIGLPPLNDERIRKAGRIRIVIDDIRVLARVNPEITADGAFLPFLSFFLQREGVVSLFVYTDNVRPNTSPTEELGRALLSIAKHAILTWNVPFEGRNRVAISVMPHSDPDNHGLVRELRVDWEHPTVTRRFELYSGIEEGKPAPVPLAVYLFDETSPFAAYTDEEDQLFREVFTGVKSENPVDPGRVIFAIPAQRYMALRDYTHLSLDSLDSHTMVFQVDEPWAVSEHKVLENLDEYLNGYLPENETPRRDETPDEDPFEIFAGTPLSGRTAGKLCRKDFFRNSRFSIKNRANTVEREEFRVPFMWDFGFLLARRGLFEMAKNQQLYGNWKLYGNWSNDDDMTIDLHCRQLVDATIPLVNDTVERIFTNLNPSLDRLPDANQDRKPKVVSWRKFLGACKMISEEHHKQTGAEALPFDAACPSVETLNALLLEMWFSELLIEGGLRYGNGKSADDLWQSITSHPLEDLLHSNLMEKADLPTEPRKFGDIQKAFVGFKEAWRNDTWTDQNTWEGRSRAFKELPLGAFCLYKVWLLLIEAFDFDRFIDPDNPFAFQARRKPDLNSVASRHWYKTGCSFSKELYQSEGIHDSLIALRMPGQFSTRGDWFLGTPKSSRSKLLAQHAIDLLSSRRANLTRMQHGLGLPVRDIVDDDACEWFSTALHCAVSAEWRGAILSPKDTTVEKQSPDAHLQNEMFSTELKYGELAWLGASEDSENAFWWLWRSDIQAYDRTCRPLQKWLVRMFHWTQDYRKRNARNWKGGFTAYDELTQKRFEEVSKYGSFEEFGHLCDVLLSELKSARKDN